MKHTRELVMTAHCSYVLRSSASRVCPHMAESSSPAVPHSPQPGGPPDQPYKLPGRWLWMRPAVPCGAHWPGGRWCPQRGRAGQRSSHGRTAARWRPAAHHQKQYDVCGSSAPRCWLISTALIHTAECTRSRGFSMHMLVAWYVCADVHCHAMAEHG